MIKYHQAGQFLWCSWQGGHFRHPRCTVRIPTLAIFHVSLFIWHFKVIKKSVLSYFFIIVTFIIFVLIKLPSLSNVLQYFPILILMFSIQVIGFNQISHSWKNKILLKFNVYHSFLFSLGLGNNEWSEILLWWGRKKVCPPLRKLDFGPRWSNERS